MHIIVFLFLDEYICCGYSLEAPRRGSSNEYPQHMFSLRNKNDISIFRMKKSALSVAMVSVNILRKCHNHETQHSRGTKGRRTTKKEKMQNVDDLLREQHINKREKDCLWKQRTHYGFENGSLGFIETLYKQ